MKKFLIVLFIVSSMVTTFAGPSHHHHGGYRGPGCPPPPPPGRYYGGCYYRNDGVRLAADIVSLVGAGLSILNPRPVIVTTPAQSVIQQPVVIEQPRTVWVKVIGTDGRVYYYQKTVNEQYFPPPQQRVIYY